MNNYYNYNNLLTKATSVEATQEDRMNLYEWFTNYGECYWNGESYKIDDDRRLYPVFASEGEPDEDGVFDGYEVVDAVIE